MLLEGRLGAQKCSLSYDRLNTVTCQWERADERELRACVYVRGQERGVLLSRGW